MKIKYSGTNIKKQKKNSGTVLALPSFKAKKTNEKRIV